MADAYSYLPGLTGDAWTRMHGNIGDVWARLPGTTGDAWERLIAPIGPVSTLTDILDRYSMIQILLEADS